jgi:carboxyl-terminal processing protease
MRQIGSKNPGDIRGAGPVQYQRTMIGPLVELLTMKNLSKRLKFEFFLLAVVAGITVGWYGPTVLAIRTPYEFFNPLVEVHNQVARFYVEPPDEQKMLNGAIQGMLNALEDPHTTYFTPEELETFETHTRGTFSGIGAEIDARGEFVTVVSPLEDSPAFEAGIMAGDIILEINGESAEGISVEEAVQRITGEEGTEVILKVRHLSGEEEKITIVRRQIEIQTVRGFQRDETGHWDFLIDPSRDIGYIRIAQFSAPTFDAFEQAINQLQIHGLRGLIIDLRYNPGGLLDSAKRISDRFLGNGAIVSTRGRYPGSEVKYEAQPANTLPDFPVVVLINEFSASASEILAGALKDNDRAIVIGTRSVGKGSVQRLQRLDNDAGGLKMTTSYYYLPSGRNIHRHPDSEQWGVDPSDGYYIPMSDEQRIEMLRVRREGDVLKDENNGAHVDEQITPQWIEQELLDPQLAGALQAMIARLESGDFELVGQSNATLLAHIGERDRLEQRREIVVDALAEIDEELARLNELILHGETVEIAEDAAGDAEEELEPQVAPASPAADDELRNMEGDEQPIPAEVLPDHEQPSEPEAAEPGDAEAPLEPAIP